MAKTGFRCIYDLKDTTAIADSTPTTAYNQTFGDISKVKDDIESANYATLEQDFFLLDGSREEMPDAPEDIVFFTDTCSDENGQFAANPILIILFQEQHSSIGIKFYFQDDFPLSMRIKWYDKDGYLTDNEVFEPDSLTYFAEHQVKDYMKIEVIFERTKPYRYVKLRYIEYGTEYVFGEGGLPVKDGSLVEECQLIPDKIAINKLTFKLIDENDDFNLGNIKGKHQVLQAGQQALAYEQVDGADILLGKFFLQSYKTDKNVTTITCTDYKGRLDEHNFREGKVYNGELAGTVIDSIMQVAGIEEYTVTDEVRRCRLYGWLKIQTCRKALREVLFACGAVVDDSRSESLDIYRTNRVITSTIARSRKFSTVTTNNDYISDVSIKYPEYTLGTEDKQIAKGTYEPGAYTIELSSPVNPDSVSINTGQIIEVKNNYITFTVTGTEAAEVILTGKQYSKEDITVTASVDKVEAGKSRAAKSFICTLLNVQQAAKRASEILDYYSMTLGIKAKYVSQGERTSQWALVENADRAYGNYVAGIEKLTTDLTGGFLGTAQLRGYYLLTVDSYYTGEIYAGEEVGDI
jgi:hypothetical protein